MMDTLPGDPSYPPGVTGNEPQISGIYPHDVVIQNAVEDLSSAKDQAIDAINDALAGCEDQGMSFNKIEVEHQTKLFAAVEAAFDNAIEDIENRMPAEEW